MYYEIVFGITLLGYVAYRTLAPGRFTPVDQLFIFVGLALITGCSWMLIRRRKR
jgi:LPXTG-motif cell wall-anchored protein